MRNKWGQGFRTVQMGLRPTNRDRKPGAPAVAAAGFFLWLFRGAAELPLGVSDYEKPRPTSGTRIGLEPENAGRKAGGSAEARPPLGANAYATRVA